MLIPVKTELACLHIQALLKKNILKAIHGSWSSGLAQGLAPHFTDAENEAQGPQACQWQKLNISWVPSGPLGLHRPQTYPLLSA